MLQQQSAVAELIYAVISQGIVAGKCALQFCVSFKAWYQLADICHQIDSNTYDQHQSSSQIRVD